jgi:hypothetical protein
MNGFLEQRSLSFAPNAKTRTGTKNERNQNNLLGCPRAVLTPGACPPLEEGGIHSSRPGEVLSRPLIHARIHIREISQPPNRVRQIPPWTKRPQRYGAAFFVQQAQKMENNKPKRNEVFWAFVMVVLGGCILFVGMILLTDSHIPTLNETTQMTNDTLLLWGDDGRYYKYPFTSQTALGIAQASECVGYGNLSSDVDYNDKSKKWVIAMDIERPGCDPVCVVSEFSGNASIDWRCSK